MKKNLATVLLVLLSFYSFSQQNTWTWMKGDTVPSQPGSFGTIGIPSPNNKPHSRYESCQWTDQQGNFWLYGGGAQNTRYSDLWKYEPATNNWTWMHGTAMLNQPPIYGTKGVANPLNTPGGNGFAASTWTDLQGNLWMFGGHDGVNGANNTLWKFNTNSNEWTWINGDATSGSPAFYGTKGISGPQNTPGARCETACTWTDNNGDLWLFGGTNSGGGVCFNDLWKYSTSSNEWAWMSGDTIANQSGVYGTRGIADPLNKPGARWCYSSWKDSSGNLWLFGGIEASSIIGMNYFNDLWKYDIQSGEWTWMHGSNQVNQQAFYPLQCSSSAFTTPGSKGEARSCWKDECDNLWLFGGRDINFDMYNDLWRYNLVSNQWYWMSGSQFPNQTSLFGTQQIPSPSNRPSARMGAVSWKNGSGFWLFGGLDNNGNEWNDLWKFTVIDTNCGFCAVPVTAIFTSPNNMCPGTCTDFINLSQGATYFQWFFSGAIPSTSTDVSPINICYNTPGTYDVTLIASNSIDSDTLHLSNYVTVYPYPLPQGILQSGDTLFANQGAVSYQWYHDGNLIQGATNYFYVASESGDFNVVATDSNGCEVEAAIFNVIADLDFISGDSGILLSPNPVTNLLTISGLVDGSLINIFDLTGRIIYSATSIDHVHVADCDPFAAGIYILENYYKGEVMHRKFIKI